MKTSMNSFSSRSGLGERFSARERSTSTVTMRRLVLQKPGSGGRRLELGGLGLKVRERDG